MEAKAKKSGAPAGPPAMVEEGTLAGVITAGEELLTCGRPDGEGEDADQVGEAGGLPALPGEREERRVGDRLGGGKA